MRFGFVITITVSALSLLAAFGDDAPVTLHTLLLEMVDREAATRLPLPSYTSRLYSSYDRRSVAPDQPGWFANNDYSQFIRTETNNGHTELVMLDASGPGAVTRFWVTVSNADGSGILRVYIDGAVQIEGPVLQILSGGALCGEPLSSSVAPLTTYLKRGHNLYLPIPYAQSCKITYEKAKASEVFYYNVEARSYAVGTAVESFSKDVLEREAVTIDEVNRRLTGCERGLLGTSVTRETFDCSLTTGNSVRCDFTGPAAIRALGLAINGGTDPQALRSTIIEMSFDGARTVWVPAGDFFGTGYKTSASRTWFSEVYTNGVMESSWVMPFKDSCTLTVRNLGTNTVTLTKTFAVAAPYNWEASRSMYFGAGWTALPKVSTRLNGSFFDVNYVTLTGAGRLVGSSVSLFNSNTGWWGEGDEKIFVDGESFPSYIGTGSEDYHGYAWCVGNVFTHPFIAQPDGTGDCKVGFVTNLRYRSLDGIPFTSGLKFDMELWHWSNVTIDYAITSFWYIRPNGTSNRGTETALAKLPISLTLDDLNRPFPVESSSGTTVFFQ